MALGRHIKANHTGAKNGGGHWGKRQEAKDYSRKIRRADGKRCIQEEQHEH